MDVKNVVDEQKIWDIIEETKNPSGAVILEILNNASKKEGLSLHDVGCLLHVEDPALIEKMFDVSGRIKDEIYGERLVFFAPLYLSNFCVNDCDYCGFHCRNPAPRKKLSLEEVAEQVRILEDMGHKRLLLECGEHPESSIDYVVGVIRTVYSTKSGKKGDIRRVNVNIAATTIENYQKLHAVGIGTYQLFQETYHRKTYGMLHKGPKADYERQLFAHDRAMKAGIEDVGLGVLFGLFDYKFDAIALVSHSQYLEKTYNVGPHTLSVPRFQPAPTVNLKLPNMVDECTLLKIISVLRMAVPYTGMIITTREKPETRAKAFKIGISQTSAASKTSPGGYGKEDAVHQFDVQDHRSIDEVLKSILDQGLLPSFCTACYRVGRTGETIMNLIKSGKIHELCRPNALLTFKEYLEDYAPLELKKKGEEIIDAYVKQIPENLRRETSIRLERVENGERDLYF